MKKEPNEVELKQGLGSRLSYGKKAARTRTHTLQARPNLALPAIGPPRTQTQERENVGLS